MNTAEYPDNTLLTIPKGMVAMHTSNLYGEIEDAVRFDAIGDALSRASILYRVEFSADKRTRTIFIEEGSKAEGLAAVSRVTTGTEVTPDPRNDMRFMRHACRREVATVLAEAA